MVLRVECSQRATVAGVKVCMCTVYTYTLTQILFSNSRAVRVRGDDGGQLDTAASLHKEILISSVEQASTTRAERSAQGLD